MDSVTYGECRCCLTQGNHRNIMKQYNINGQRQIFCELFMECFNILLSKNPRLTSLICSTCIDRLRDAHTFKTLVLNNEKMMLDSLTNRHNMEFVNVCSQPQDMTQYIELGSVKVEYDENNEYYREDVDEEAGCGLESPHQNDLVSGETQLLARFNKPLPLPTRDSLFNICPKYLGYLEAMKGKTIESADIKLLLETKSSKKPRQCRSKKRTEKIALATNTAFILENSNAVPFKMKMQSGFPCFYCRKIFPSPKDLREHQETHAKSTLFPLLSKYTADSLIVYADVTNLKCSICNKDQQSLKELTSHLKNAHCMKFHEDYSDRIIPFKLNDRESNFDCQICGLHFETFGAIDKHMGAHYRNFVCELCGSGFVTKHRLKVHTYALHQKKNSQIVCEICKKVFVTRLKYRIHYEYVHEKLKKLQCTLCDEKFLDYYARQRHLEDKHGVEKLQYKCNHCQRQFSRKFSLTSHVERYHMLVKKHQCETCPFMCFTKQELENHMYKHQEVKKFECEVCRKLFMRKKSLDMHLRIHNDDRRYFCHLCGESFVQNCTLKSHLKLHSENFDSV